MLISLKRSTLSVAIVTMLACGFASAAQAGPEVLRMATTTSTQNSGLLDYLLPPFEQSSGLRVHVIAVGTGKALRMGATGDVDLVMVHAPRAELAWVKKGAFVMRRTLMHNYFVLLGPPADPARAAGADGILAALRQIAAAGANFISRGDNSGTHSKEMELWEAAGIEPDGSWYQEVGQGMGRTLIIANERLGYLLSDEATFLAFGSQLELKTLSKREPSLRNTYSAMAVNPKRHPHVRHREAVRLIEWLISPQGQRRISQYRRAGRALFEPDSPAVR